MTTNTPEEKAIKGQEQFTLDIMDEYKQYGKETRKANKMLVIGFIAVITACIIALCGMTIYFTQEMKDKDTSHAMALEKQRKEFLDYLAMYDYGDTQIEATQDGQGVNIVGGGDVTNGAESKASQTDTQTEK